MALPGIEESSYLAITPPEVLLESREIDRDLGQGNRMHLECAVAYTACTSKTLKRQIDDMNGGEVLHIKPARTFAYFLPSPH